MLSVWRTTSSPIRLWYSGVCTRACVCMRVGGVYGAVKSRVWKVLKAEFRLFSVGSWAPLEIQYEDH